ncbi:hypothetical protein VM1G_07512 [Cytospora mali]|uniref:F-box domain-containing protein n=1 Tax=Cytospora mali TaxID=578113 RepID=A0A194W6N4_CYTMA|nr:hypothetical protein VM1G_07512 [Valsa mali]
MHCSWSERFRAVDMVSPHVDDVDWLMVDQELVAGRYLLPRSTGKHCSTTASSAFPWVARVRGQRSLGCTEELTWVYKAGACHPLNLDLNHSATPSSARSKLRSRTGTMYTLREIPVELIHLICSFLNVRDVRRLRLTCRKVGAVAASYALAELVFYLHHGDFEMLRYFADHPEYSGHVKSLAYSVKVLEMQSLSFGDFAEQKLQHDRDLWYNRPVFDMDHEPREDSEEFLQGAYQRYRQVHDPQTRIVAERLDATTLQEVIPKFRNLKSVMVLQGEQFKLDWSFFVRGCKMPKTPFDNLLVPVINYPGRACCHHMDSLLLPLRTLPTNQLRTLRLGEIDWSFFKKLQDSSRLDQMVEICRNLTTFDLCVYTRTATARDGDEGFYAARCKAALRKGGLRRLLGSMTRLEILNISFTYNRFETMFRSEAIYPAALSDIVPEDMCWKNLRKFKFDRVEGTRQEWVGFILRHSSTVSRFHLQSPRLVRSSWVFFVEDLRLLATTISLENMEISGDVYGEREEGGTPEEVQVGDMERFWIDIFPDSGLARNIKKHGDLHGEREEGGTQEGEEDEEGDLRAYILGRCSENPIESYRKRNPSTLLRQMSEILQSCI